MMACKCDRCGKVYDWYETVYADHEFNCENNHTKINAYIQKNNIGPTGFSANCLKFMFLEPANTNCSTNHGTVSADIEECKEGNNELIMLCRDCMSEFMDSLTDFWNRV